MSAGDPKDAPRYRFNELTPDQFERLVFNLVWSEDRRVVRLRAPDGGLDTLLPDRKRDAKATHGWQAKRHTGSIDVTDCQRSLDRAVRFWAPKAVTFVFPHDLTAREHAAFTREVAGRHPDLAVDYWGEAALLARLDTREGRRVAAAAFHEQDAFRLAERMLRAGSPLQTGADYFEAETAIVEGLADADPDYDWVIVTGTADSAGASPVTKGAVLRLSFTTDDVVMHADLVARHASPEREVGAILTLDDSPEGRQAREWLDSLRTTGGRLTLNRGISLHLSDLPQPFGDLFDPAGTSGEFVIRATSQPVAYYAQASAGEASDQTALDIDLLPAEAPPEWDAVLEGRVGSLIITLSFRWEVDRGAGESRLTFSYRSTDAPHELEAKVLRWMIAVHETGHVVLKDRYGTRPTLDQHAEFGAPPPWMRDWALLHENLATIEKAAGQPTPPVPDPLSRQDFEDVARVANVLRSQRYTATLKSVVITLKPGAPGFKLKTIIRNMGHQQLMVARLFGAELPVAHEKKELPPMIVIERAATDDGGARVKLVPIGADEIEIVCEIIPLAE